MNHGIDCPHLYEHDGKILRDPMKPCEPDTDTDPSGEIEGCEDCGLSDCETCGRTIRRCRIVRNGCEFCTPFEENEENKEAVKATA